MERRKEKTTTKKVCSSIRMDAVCATVRWVSIIPGFAVALQADVELWGPRMNNAHRLDGTLLLLLSPVTAHAAKSSLFRLVSGSSSVPACPILPACFLIIPSSPLRLPFNIMPSMQSNDSLFRLTLRLSTTQPPPSMLTLYDRDSISFSPVKIEIFFFFPRMTSGGKKRGVRERGKRE